jgi:hypothetical protein
MDAYTLEAPMAVMAVHQEVRCAAALSGGSGIGPAQLSISSGCAGKRPVCAESSRSGSGTHAGCAEIRAS